MPPKKKLSAFFIGAFLGAFLSMFALWAFQVSGAFAAAAVIVIVAIAFGLIAAFACPKSFEKVVIYFLTIMNP